MTVTNFLKRHALVIEWTGGVIPSIIAAVWMAANISSSEYSYWVFTPVTMVFMLIFWVEERKSLFLLNLVYFLINVFGLYSRHWL
jgi:hypothetical protein